MTGATACDGLDLDAGYPTGDHGLDPGQLRGAASQDLLGGVERRQRHRAQSGFTSRDRLDHLQDRAAARSTQMCAFCGPDQQRHGNVQVTFGATVDRGQHPGRRDRRRQHLEPARDQAGTNSGTSDRAVVHGRPARTTSGSSEILFGADENGTATTAPTWSTTPDRVHAGLSTLALTNGATSEMLAVYLGPTVDVGRPARSARARPGGRSASSSSPARGSEPAPIDRAERFDRSGMDAALPDFGPDCLIAPLKRSRNRSIGHTRARLTPQKECACRAADDSDPRSGPKTASR